MPEIKELLCDGIYYDVTNFIKRHPGGNVMDLYISSGEDSMLAVQQFHHRSRKKVASIMKSLPHRKFKEGDVHLKQLDPAKYEKHKALTKDFLELYAAFEKEGIFDPNPLHVFFRICDIFIYLTVGFFFLHLQPQSLPIRCLGVLFLSFGFGRGGWVMHEGSHHSLLGKPKLDWLIHCLVYGVIMGHSPSNWTSQHSKHHAMPQHIKYDTDLQSLPLVAFHTKAVKNPAHGKGFLIQYQRWLFSFVGTLIITLAWKLYLHPSYCIRKGKYWELFYIIVHHIFFISFTGALNYWIAYWWANAYLFGNVILSHSHLPVTEDATHWVEYGLIHTANVRSSTFGWVDYWMGNLNYQIEHHLFPTMPQYKNKLCRDRVKALAKKHNLPYNLYSYGEAVVKSLDNLGMVANELAMS